MSAMLSAKGANMVAVASGKGGVGKTWLSITLSHALARHGRRVLLFDGDLGFVALPDFHTPLAIFVVAPKFSFQPKNTSWKGDFPRPTI